jgi:hypothetical protein
MLFARRQQARRSLRLKRHQARRQPQRRWFAFSLKGLDANKNKFEIATHVYLTFYRPTSTNCRRVVSPSNPNLHFNILDITQRSMVIGINNVDISGETIEVQVSEAPL